jgi:hypothetical protein
MQAPTMMTLNRTRTPSYKSRFGKIFGGMMPWTQRKRMSKTPDMSAAFQSSTSDAALTQELAAIIDTAPTITALNRTRPPSCKNRIGKISSGMLPWTQRKRVSKTPDVSTASSSLTSDAALTQERAAITDTVADSKSLAYDPRHVLEGSVHVFETVEKQVDPPAPTPFQQQYDTQGLTRSQEVCDDMRASQSDNDVESPLAIVAPKHSLRLKKAARRRLKRLPGKSSFGKSMKQNPRTKATQSPRSSENGETHGEGELQAPDILSLLARAQLAQQGQHHLQWRNGQRILRHASSFEVEPSCEDVQSVCTVRHASSFEIKPKCDDVRLVYTDPRCLGTSFFDRRDCLEGSEIVEG